MSKVTRLAERRFQYKVYWNNHTESIKFYTKHTAIVFISSVGGMLISLKDERAFRRMFGQTPITSHPEPI